MLHTPALFSTKIKSHFCLTSFVCQPEAHLKLDDFLQLNDNCKIKLIGISHYCQTINEITHSKSILQGIFLYSWCKTAPRGSRVCVKMKLCIKVVLKHASLTYRNEMQCSKLCRCHDNQCRFVSYQLTWLCARINKRLPEQIV